MTTGALSFPFPYDDILEPPSEYTWLRGERPVARVELPSGDHAWLITCYDHARAVFDDRRFARIGEEPERGNPVDHERWRAVVSEVFTPRYAQTLEPRVREIARRLLDGLADRGSPADLVEAYHFPLAMEVVCELLGVPGERQRAFRAWARGAVSLSGRPPAEIAAGDAEMAEFFQELIDHKRVARDGADLLTRLVRWSDAGPPAGGTADDGEHARVSAAGGLPGATEVRPGSADAEHGAGADLGGVTDLRAGRLTGVELLDTAHGLLLAGYETTANALGKGMLALFRNPGQFAAVRADPALLPAAVEEMLRYAPPHSGLGVPRYAVEDVALGDTVIPRGDTVLVPPCAGNRDPGRFADADRFLVSREGVASHLTLGHGRYRCIGAPLARIEMRVAVGELLARFPGLRLAVPADEIRMRQNLVTEGPVSLPVAW